MTLLGFKRLAIVSVLGWFGAVAVAWGADSPGSGHEAAAATLDEPLRQELLGILKNDQTLRLQLNAVEQAHGVNSPELKAMWVKISRQDHADLVKVEAILAKDGWVGPNRVGGQASQALFLVIQHSDHATQEKYLPMMRAAVKAGNARGASLALLEDRVALGEGRPQVYGSQLSRVAGEKQYYLSPLADPDHVDERRAAVGLPPLAQYLKHWNLTWDVEAYKRMLPDIARREGISLSPAGAETKRLPGG